MSKIRTIQLLGGGKSGGAELFFVRFVTALSQRPEVFEVLPIVKQGGWAAEQLSARGIRYATAGFGGIMDLSTKRICQRVAAEFQPDVCMSWMNRPTRFMPQPPRRDGRVEAGGWATVGRLGGYYDMKYYRGKATHLVTATRSIADHCVKEGWPEANLDVIANFPPPPPDGWQAGRASLRRELGFADEDTVLIVAARLHKVKGFDTALDALTRLPDTVKLLAVGGGPEEDALKAQAERLGIAKRVRWVGWRNNLSDYAAVADIWLTPSRHEPLGNSLLDAWSHELPLVSSRVSGPISLIDEGQDGLMVAPDDDAALAGAISRVMNEPDLKQRLIDGGRRKMQTTYSEDAIIGTYEALYRRLTPREAG